VRPQKRSRRLLGMTGHPNAANTKSFPFNLLKLLQNLAPHLPKPQLVGRRALLPLTINLWLDAPTRNGVGSWVSAACVAAHAVETHPAPFLFAGPCLTRECSRTQKFENPE
jgi:hypothetical protein